MPAALAAVATNFAKIVVDMAATGIAHGDLQHGNILVLPNGDLKLIDYDGMFVPGLQSMGATETGHVNYQSPARTMSDWGPELDRFSAWTIYLSLVVLTIDPALWMSLHAEGEEALLFTKADYTQRAQARTPSPRSDKATDPSCSQ